ncbi:M1 family aminopeptidase [Arenimonas sp.]|uniref:M1 family metallopeptidase n=1 Tax=Arenimonas sp. TaxID=1872635 RepID=UPI0039E48E69
MRHLLAAAAAFFFLSSGALAADDGVPRGRLPRTVVPGKVALELKIDPAQPRFSGVVRIQARFAEATDTIWMHGRDLNIVSARVAPKNGRNQTLTAAQVDVSGVLKLTAAKPIEAGEALIEITYDAAFGKLDGAYRVKPDGNDYVLTQLEAISARSTFPGFDEPSFKQPWDVSLVVPNGNQALANTRELRTEKAGEGWTRHVFATTENLPSYLIAFAVGPWDIVDGPDLAPNAVRSYPVKLRGIAAKGQGGKMKYALDHTGEIVSGLEDYFGSPYPFDKLDLVAAPDFAAGAMENPGLIVYRDTLLFANENSDVRSRQGYWGTHAHELAHQWFGDLVTMPWWDDIWLNEAFATWMGNKVVGKLQPGFHTERGLQEGALGAMGADSLATTRRVREPISDFTEIEAAFDGITYQKGGAMLAMFERYVGEERFRDAIRNYLREHSRGNATSGDLIDAIAEASEDPAGVRAAFNSFIDQPGVPIVHVGAKCAAGGRPTLLVEQQRYLPVGSTASAAGQWKIPLCVRYGDKNGSQAQCQFVSAREETIELATDSCPDFVMPNADGAGYYRFAMSPGDQKNLESNFDRLNEREQRAFSDSLEAAFDAGAIDAPAFLSASTPLANAPVRQTAMSPVGNIGWMIGNLARDETQKQALRAHLARIYGPRLAALGTSPRPGDSDDDRLMRNSLVNLMAETAKEPKLRAELAAKGRAVLGLGGDKALHLDAVAPDQRALALRMAMQEGGAEVFDAMTAHLASTQDPQLRGQLLGAMSDAKDPALVERMHEMALKPGKLRRNELRFATGAGDTETDAGRKARREWLDANFEAIQAQLAPGGATLVYGYTSGMCSDSEAATVEPKFAERLRNLEGGPRTLAQSIEGIKLCAALKEKQRAAGLGRFGNAAAGSR